MTKRINLSVNLEDSETLAEEVRDVVMAQSRQIAREVIDETMKSEIERISLRHVNSLKEGSNWNPTVRNIIDAVSKRMEQEFRKNEDILPMIDAILEQKVNALLDRRIAEKGDLDAFIQEYIDKSIASALINRTNQ